MIHLYKILENENWGAVKESITLVIYWCELVVGKRRHVEPLGDGVSIFYLNCDGFRITCICAYVKTSDCLY
jgi:hypothetical protein